MIYAIKIIEKRKGDVSNDRTEFNIVQQNKRMEV